MLPTTHPLRGKISHVAMACAVASQIGSGLTLSGCAGQLPVRTTAAQNFYPQPNWPRGTSDASYRLLSRNMAYQHTDAACSVATVTLVLNALRAARGLPAIGSDAVLATDKSGHWQRATQMGGQGISLDKLHLLALTAAAALGDVPRDRRVSLQAVHMPSKRDAPALTTQATQALAYVLGRMAQAPAQWFVMLNFRQNALVSAGAAVGHFSVAAAYDEKRGRVLVLDVDEDRIAPYWVKLSALVSAMQEPDDATRETRGYLILHAAA